MPSIWATNNLGFNQLHITSYIVNFDDPKGPGGEGGPNNYEVNFKEDRAPETGNWFRITVSQRPMKVNKKTLFLLFHNYLLFNISCF